MSCASKMAPEMVIKLEDAKNIAKLLSIHQMVADLEEEGILGKPHPNPALR